MPKAGERVFMRCEGGPLWSRLVRWPDVPTEVEVDDGTYVLVDDGPPDTWWYQFVPRSA
jgi:hypothetical protein